MLSRHDIGTRSNNVGLQLIPLVVIAVILPWPWVRVRSNWVITPLYARLVIYGTDCNRRVCRPYRCHSPIPIIANCSYTDYSGLWSSIHSVCICSGAIISRIVSSRIGTAAEWHWKYVDTSARVIISPVGIDILNCPIYAGHSVSRIGRPCIGHDLDVNEICPRGITLVIPVRVSRTKSYSRNMGPMPIAIIRIIPPVITVLLIPWSGITASHPLGVRQLIGLSFIVVVIVREIVQGEVLVIHARVGNSDYNSWTIIAVVSHGFTINIRVSNLGALSCSIQVGDQNILLFHQYYALKHQDVY